MGVLYDSLQWALSSVQWYITEWHITVKCHTLRTCINTELHSDTIHCVGCKVYTVWVKVEIWSMTVRSMSYSILLVVLWPNWPSRTIVTIGSISSGSSNMIRGRVAHWALVATQCNDPRIINMALLPFSEDHLLRGKSRYNYHHHEQQLQNHHGTVLLVV